MAHGQVTTLPGDLSVKSETGEDVSLMAVRWCVPGWRDSLLFPAFANEPAAGRSIGRSSAGNEPRPSSPDGYWFPVGKPKIGRGLSESSFARGNPSVLGYKSSESVARGSSCGRSFDTRAGRTLAFPARRGRRLVVLMLLILRDERVGTEWDDIYENCSGGHVLVEFLVWDAE